MQMNVAGLRRNIKNLAHNYSDAQVKVREATSNDPWGPSSTLMAEIADLTYNVVAFSEIMQMIWKRTNDHGKNWRHVYKALLLLEYLIKTGSEKVAQQCKENIFSIQTLKDFQHLEEGKDQGVHVREKAKQMVNLLKDDERLKAERARALKAKERFARTASGFGSDGSIDGPSADRATPVWPESDRRPDYSTADMEFVRPQTVGEEELQLQLAIAMSKEEADQEDQKRRSDDVRLQLALSQSENDFKKADPPVAKNENNLVDLLDAFGSTDLAVGGAAPSSSTDPWGMPVKQTLPPKNDLWSAPTTAKPADPWLPPPPTAAARTISPAAAVGGNASAVEGWLSNVSPPVLPAKPNNSINSELEGAWGGKPAAADPWNVSKTQPTTQVPNIDPWNAASTNGKPADPWAPLANGANGAAATGMPSAAPRQTTSALGALTPGSDLDDFDVITNRSKSALQVTSSPVNDMLNKQNNNNLNDLLGGFDPLAPMMPTSSQQQAAGGAAKPKINNPADFLGENSALVNLDNLIKPVNASSNNNAYNPFESPAMRTKNLFQQNQPQNPSINQLKQQQQFASLNQDPWAPVNNNDTNQFDIVISSSDGNNNNLSNDLIKIDENADEDEGDDDYNDDIFNTSFVEPSLLKLTTSYGQYSKSLNDIYSQDIPQNSFMTTRAGNQNNLNNNNNGNAAWMNPNQSNPFLS